MTYRPPDTLDEHFDWLRRRWSQRTLAAAATMTYIAPTTDDADADRQLRAEGNNSLLRLRAAGVLRPDLTVVEIGCGPGRVATELAAYLIAGQYIGADLSPEYVALCRTRCPDGRFLTTPGIGCELPAATADLVVSFTVFCHMPTEAVWLWLRDAARVLKPGGRTYLQFHNVACDHQWDEFTRHAESHRFLTDPGYPRGMEWVTVERLHRTSGLTIERAIGVDEDAGGPRSWFVVARK